MFSVFNTFVFCVPARWLWSDKGFLKALGAVDVAGSCGVNLVGGAGALVGAVMLGPRIGRWDQRREPPMGSAGNAIIGVFMLWWAWIAFNQVNKYMIFSLILFYKVVFVLCRDQPLE